MVERKISLIHTKDKGRCCAVNEDTSQGDILLVSKPYGVVPSFAKKEKVCANCLDISNTNKMIPCRQNCQYVFYCSNECEQKQWMKFHQHECSFIKKICTLKGYDSNEDVINYAQLVMRMLTQRFNDIFSESSNISIANIFSLMSHFDQFTNDKKNGFETVAKVLTEYIVTKLIPCLTKDKEARIYSMESFLPDSTDAKQLQNVTADRWLSEMTDLCSFRKDDIHVRETLEYLLKKVYILICIEEVNGYSHRTFLFAGSSQASQVYATGFYLIPSFINHSCSANVDRILVRKNNSRYETGDLVFFAARALEKGEELCISYGGRKCDIYMQDQVKVADIIDDQAIRKQIIYDDYFFNCQCVRCVSEGMGKLDESFMKLVQQLKCKQLQCQGWLIPSCDKQTMCCEACGMS